MKSWAGPGNEATLSCTRTTRGVAVLGVWSIFAFHYISPCSFGNKRMCLLTCVYGTNVNGLVTYMDPVIISLRAVAPCRKYQSN